PPVFLFPAGFWLNVFVGLHRGARDFGASGGAAGRKYSSLSCEHESDRLHKIVATVVPGIGRSRVATSTRTPCRGRNRSWISSNTRPVTSLNPMACPWCAALWPTPRRVPAGPPRNWVGQR